MILLVALFQLAAAHAESADPEACLKTAKNCANVDIDVAKAREAFEKGCEARDWESCTRLGQYWEVRGNDASKAAAAYDKACREGKDKYACDQAQEIHERACFVDNNKKFCDGREPAGDVRAYVFLKTFESKYADALRQHDFSSHWSLDATEKLYTKLKKEKNKKLLRALERELKSRMHDGSDAETIQYDIQCMRDKCPSDEYWNVYKGRS
jgi:hypothetical protein